MTKADERASFGLVGLGVMGENLALNLEEKGESVAVWDRDELVRSRFAAEHAGARFRVADELAVLPRLLAAPRRVLMMITAGAPVDAVLEDLAPHLERGDVVIDGGNSRFEDTQRRERALAERGLHFVGMGVSGGAEGARHGPSLMPGGSREAWQLLAPTLEAIAARTEAGPCVTHVGADGAGHFVKIVHNGIEYADMQLIAEAYDLLSRAGGLTAPAIAATFATWNEGPLESFLIEISARIFTVPDPAGRGPLIEAVLDRAGQKGTGRWTCEAALALGVAIPTLSAAVDARVLSSAWERRQRLARLYRMGDQDFTFLSDPGFRQELGVGLLAAKVCAYAQGFELVRVASRAHGWDIRPRELARIWKGGCIIRARLLDRILTAFDRDPELESLVLDRGFVDLLQESHEALRQVVYLAVQRGIGVPALSASLAWLDTVRSARLPLNLTQAQRDAFGAHGYQRLDDPDGAPRHSDWLG